MSETPSKFSAVIGDGRRATDLSAEMCERVKDVVRSYGGKMPLATAIGVLHIAAKGLMDTN